MAELLSVSEVEQILLQFKESGKLPNDLEPEVLLGSIYSAWNKNVPPGKSGRPGRVYTSLEPLEPGTPKIKDVRGKLSGRAGFTKNDIFALFKVLFQHWNGSHQPWAAMVGMEDQLTEKLFHNRSKLLLAKEGKPESVSQGVILYNTTGCPTPQELNQALSQLLGGYKDVTFSINVEFEIGTATLAYWTKCIIVDAETGLSEMLLKSDDQPDLYTLICNPPTGKGVLVKGDQDILSELRKNRKSSRRLHYERLIRRLKEG